MVRKVFALLAGAVLAVGFGVSARPPDARDVHDPANAVANLDVHPELRATLFASEPALTNPTNLDIDHRGRVWVCDVMNYRGHNGLRPDGDRILILEDTKGDGKADKVKVFYQGRDVDSAMGICVLGHKLIVSCSPNILVFTFDDDDKILKKECLFTQTGQAQHDHSAHSFVFGPDGRLYWNFGNTGHSVHDKDGKLVIDRAGNPVVDNGKPYHGGMVFRCEPDGSRFEVLAHNFRNNYEVAVDSFGTLWQSDNDDDGNRGVRVNYVMEFGNYGYRDEMTGAGWQAPRTNREAEVPLRHWHLNDPGVVPNLLQTGAGSPCAICVNEGDLLPAVFRNQVIHCDAGPSIVRAYPVTRDGAGYKATIVNILDGRRNNWFRPVDPCLAPDGSLFVTDWYDPGVGGHGQADSNRGRIFRVAPPGVRYQVPRFDFTTAAGAANALKNPNLAVRYLAWTALHKRGEGAEKALLEVWHSDNPRHRARALWLLGRIPGRGPHYVEEALGDADPDLRITSLRLARQLDLDLVSLVRKVVHDPSPQVRRDAAIALRHRKVPQAAGLWAELALEHDGKDRWYLEALGIGADGNWDDRFEAWLKAVGERWNCPAGRDVVWRSRASRTAEYLGRLIADPSTSVAELPRYFRAFDFQDPSPARDEVLTRLAFAPAEDGPRRELVMTESLTRLRARDLSKESGHADAVNRFLDRHRGTQLLVDLVERFNLSARYPDLLAVARQDPEGQLGVNAVRLLLGKGQVELLEGGLRDADPEAAVRTARALGSSRDDRAAGPLLALVKDRERTVELRRQAVRALGRSRQGARALLEMARAKELPEELKAAAGLVLQAAEWQDVKEKVAALFPVPAARDNVPLPAIGELVKRHGDGTRGRDVFQKTGNCATCHVVNGAGKEVGPDLSEIGKKLSREGLYESILYPSASISHNYETYLLETKAGTVVTGLLVSQTPEEITLKGADALVRSFKKKEIESFRVSPVSLMPADLHKALSVQDLADLVEYLLSLKEAKGKK